MLILGPLDVAQVILQDLLEEHLWRCDLGSQLADRSDDGITFPHHLDTVICMGSLALMPKNRLHFILLLTIDHNGRRRSLLPFELLGPVEPFQVRYMEDRMDPLG